MSHQRRPYNRKEALARYEERRRQEEAKREMARARKRKQE